MLRSLSIVCSSSVGVSRALLATVGFALLAQPVAAHEPILTEDNAPTPLERMACAIESAGDGRGLVVAVSGQELTFTFDLRPATITAIGARAQRMTAHGPVETSNANNIYRGEIAGVEGSRVAMTVSSNSIDGLARSGREVFLFAPVDGADCEVDVYRLSALADKLPVARALSDSQAANPGSGGRMLEGALPFVLEYAAVADFEWFQRWGANSTSRMQSVVDAADLIFIDQMNITLEVSHSQVFETAGDPFSDFTSGNLFSNFRDATTEFGNWRDSEGGAVEAAGLAHLFSDKALGLTSGGAGFGFIDTLCHRSRGVSLSTTRFFNSISFSALIVAHEIGHNFGAPHDGEGACAAAPDGFIMASSATGTEFSDCSKGIMTTNGSSADCITEGTEPICSQPASTGAAPTATDCLFILKAAVGLATCDPECICAPTGSLPAKASDALLCLNVAVGAPLVLNCPCI
jgi:hypothetical protein